MSVLWIGLVMVAVILSGFFAIKMSRGANSFQKGNGGERLQSNLVPLQVYTGDDILGHPDLKKIAELRGDRRRAK